MIVLRNVLKLYDGRSAGRSSLHSGVDLAIDKGRIDWMRPHDPVARFGSATVVDGTRSTVTPGLIDCHGHVTMLGLGDRDMATMEGQESLLYVEKILHRTLVEGGVTTMRDVGGATAFLKRMVDDGVMIGPRLKIAICMLSTTGGHADFRGPDRAWDDLSKLWGMGPGRPSSVVDGPWECRKRVREIAACGADLIKICTSPGVASPSDKLEHRDFSAEEVAAICDEANGRGLPVAAHAHSRNGIELAIAHGVQDIQHISFFDERLADLALKRGCTVTPTSWVIQILPAVSYLSEAVRHKVQQVNAVHSRAVGTARAAGLKVLGGTDPVLPGMHGRNYMEIVSLVRDGLHPMQAWHGMTGLAAREIGQTDTGTIEPGKRADLLVATGDVLENPELLDSGALLEVVKDGVGYRGGLPELPQATYRGATRDIWRDDWPEGRR